MRERRPGSDRTEAERLPLLRIDPGLGRGLDAASRRRAEAAISVPVVSIPPGPWAAPAAAPPGVDLGLIVVAGKLLREVRVSGGRSLELVGDGDLLRPWQEDASSFCRSSWRALTDSRLAVLDRPCAEALAQWPALTTALVERTLRRSRFMAVEAAVSNQVGIERRILTLLWQLAEKWGRHEPGKVVVTIKLTHQMLGDIIGARRPSVSLAVRSLTKAGSIERRGDRCWVLLGKPPEFPEA